MSKKIIPVGTRRRSKIDPHEVSDRIGVPVESWPGRCHEISGLLLATELVSGTLRYGMFLGPTHDDGHFKGRMLTHHGWIEREAAKACPTCGGHFNIAELCCDKNGAAPAVVIDPTRWVFENVKPYIFEGHDAEGYYDVASNKLGRALMRPFPNGPEPWHSEQAKRDVTIKADVKVLVRIASLVHHHGSRVLGIEDKGITMPNYMLHWIANLPPSDFGEHARGFYTALEEMGNRALVPQDNWEIVMGDGFYGQRESVKARVQKGKRK